MEKGFVDLNSGIKLKIDFSWKFYAAIGQVALIVFKALGLLSFSWNVILLPVYVFVASCVAICSVAIFMTLNEFFSKGESEDGDDETN